jgi:hypothetical protein
MQFLKIDPKDGNFEYVTGDEGPVIEFNVRYLLGGQDFFGYGNKPRGLYIYISPTTYEKRTTEGGIVYTSKISRITLGASDQISGGYVFLESLQRKSAKKMEMAARYFDQFAPIIANLWLTDYRAAKQMLIDKAEEYKQTLAAKAA